MEIKLGSFNLKGWQLNNNKLITMIKVCSASNRKTLGIITNIGASDHYWRGYLDSKMVIQTVEIYWLSGPHKGTKQIKNTSDLVNYDAYKACIKAELKKMEDLEAEADKTGM